MDRQIEEAETKDAEVTEPKPSNGSGHVMCSSRLWGIAGFLGCSYFVWLSFSHVLRNEYDWPHDGWTAATYIVWILLLGGLALDTRCWRERVFFGILVLDFAIGFSMTVWRTIPAADVRAARLGTGKLWTLAALVSLTPLRGIPRGEKTLP